MLMSTLVIKWLWMILDGMGSCVKLYKPPLLITNSKIKILMFNTSQHFSFVHAHHKVVRIYLKYLQFDSLEIDNLYLKIANIDYFSMWD